MGKTKIRAIRSPIEQYEDDSSSDSDSDSEEVLPVDNSDEDDEEIVKARENLRNYGRGWRSVALLQESDKEDEHPDEQPVEHPIESDIDDHAADIDLDGVHSDYFDSSDPGSYRDSTEEDPDLRDEDVRKKSRYPTFKHCKGIPNFELSMLFESNEQFKNAVSNYAIMSRHDIRFTKNEPNRCRAKCLGSSDCPWVIFASYNKNVESFQVKTFVADHTCEPKRGLKRLTSKYLFKEFYDLIAAHPDIKIRYLKPFMETKLQLDVSLAQCKRVRKSVISDLEGNCIAEFGKLRDYAEELLFSNPGSTVSLLTDRVNENDQAIFKAFYCCFKGCKDGLLNGCRPVLGIDGCFLKGLVKGELLTAIGRDGNNQMFPVAWAVVLVENTEMWTWFLNLLRHDLETSEGEGWTLISDRQKGLVGAVADTWSKAEHRFCCRHLYANWSKNYSGRQLKHLFWSLAKCTNRYDFDQNFKELEQVHPAAAKDLMLVDPKYWCKAFFSPQSKCDSCDNNLCEAFNGTILEARCKSIISMLEEIRRAMMRRIRDKRLGVSSWKNDWGPLIHRKLLNNIRDSHVWVCEWNGGGSYEVRSGRSQYVVRLRQGVCTCGAWELSGIPCPHSIRAIHDAGEKPEDYLSLWYKTNTYLRAYQRPIEPIRGENMWPRSEHDGMLPPKLRKMPGRPKKKRRREVHEPQVKNKLSRQGRTMTCQVCKGKGHNARNKSCPGRIVPSSQRSGITTANLSQSTPPYATRSRGVTTNSGTTNRFGNPEASGSTSVPPTSKYVSPFHKDCRPKSKPKKRVQLSGLGLYINPETGRSILNPGTSMARVIDRGSQISRTNKKASMGAASGGRG